jgi:putative ABC transport system permease protein
MSNIVALIAAMEQVSIAVFVVMLFIITVGITNSYRMVVIERIQEIGTLRAMGAQRNWVFRLFVSESVFIALMGSLGGILGSFGLMALISQFDVSNIGPLGMFSVGGALQFPVSLSTYLVPVLTTAFVAALAVYVPARKASRMAPGEALRAAS